MSSTAADDHDFGEHGKLDSHEGAIEPVAEAPEDAEVSDIEAEEDLAKDLENLHIDEDYPPAEQPSGLATIRPISLRDLADPGLGQADLNSDVLDSEYREDQIKQLMDRKAANRNEMIMRKRQGDLEYEAMKAQYGQSVALRNVYLERRDEHRVQAKRAHNGVRAAEENLKHEEELMAGKRDANKRIVGEYLEQDRELDEQIARLQGVGTTLLDHAHQQEMEEIELKRSKNREERHEKHLKHIRWGQSKHVLLGQAIKLWVSSRRFTERHAGTSVVAVMAVVVIVAFYAIK